MTFLHKKYSRHPLLHFTFYILYFTLFTCVACSSNEKPDVVQVSHFFDLKGYFQEQMQQNEQYTAVQKTVGIDGKQQTKILDDINWKRELSVFAAADINKAAWQDKYRTDTMATINAVNIIYTALEDDLKTRTINIQLDRDTVKYISIEQLSENFIYRSQKTLNYSPQASYTLENRQKAPFLKEHFYEINVEFQN